MIRLVLSSLCSFVPSSALPFFRSFSSLDPLSHLLFARLLADLRDERTATRGVIAATTLGGITPDVDIALIARGWDVYLRWHEAGTHSLVGTFVTAVLAAAVVRRFSDGPSWPALIAGAWIGTLSHVFFDLVSSATVQPLWPITTWRASAPIVAMADPLAIACVLAGAFALYVWPRAPRTAGAVTLALLALVFGAKLMTRAWATDAYREAAGASVTERVTEATWGDWRTWKFFDRTRDGQVRAWRVDGWTGDVTLRFARDAQHDVAFARRSRLQFATARNFADTHEFAFATAEPREGGRVVFWSDPRFCWSADEDVDPQEGVPHQDVRPPSTPVRCAMWFGGSLDPAGRPVEALVWLGGHLQRRAPGGLATDSAD
jgi:membrane-bound metal-dependent hydrolase YbcI (DUF457 family)